MQHVVSLLMSVGDQKLAYDWCTASYGNMKERWTTGYMLNGNTPVWFMDAWIKVEWRFRDQEDAVMFTLVWCA
jgi:hypothetical protein